jgi:hypothetical protein
MAEVREIRDPAGADRRLREVTRLSLAFVLEAATSGMAGLATIDAVLVMAVNQANIAPLTRDSDARLRYGALDAPAPDDERRPVSVSAVAASLGLPYETARRRMGRLADRGVCVLAEAGVVVPQGFLGSESYLASARSLHERAWSFYRDARAAGLVGDLPASNYPTDSGVPIRGAARLLADYLLRTSELFVSRFGDLVSSLIAMRLLLLALGTEPAAGRRGGSVAALAARRGIPAETVRRHVLEMAARGDCQRRRAEVSLPPGLLEAPAFTELLGDNAVNVSRLFAGLAERGVIEAWEKLRPTVGRALASRA